MSIVDLSHFKSQIERVVGSRRPQHFRHRHRRPQASRADQVVVTSAVDAIHLLERRRGGLELNAVKKFSRFLFYFLWF